jgi:hypothetical protein
MGSHAEALNVTAMHQQSVTVNATQTTYVFTAAGVQLTVVFASPSAAAGLGWRSAQWHATGAGGGAGAAEDVAALSLPVSVVQWRVRAVDGRPHRVALYFDATAELVAKE